jgi:hypothetical protein
LKFKKSEIKVYNLYFDGTNFNHEVRNSTRVFKILCHLTSPE